MSACIPPRRVLPIGVVETPRRNHRRRPRRPSGGRPRASRRPDRRCGSGGRCGTPAPHPGRGCGCARTARFYHHNPLEGREISRTACRGRDQRAAAPSARAWLCPSLSMSSSVTTPITGYPPVTGRSGPRITGKSVGRDLYRARGWRLRWAAVDRASGTPAACRPAASHLVAAVGHLPVGADQDVRVDEPVVARAGHHLQFEDVGFSMGADRLSIQFGKSRGVLTHRQQIARPAAVPDRSLDITS